MSSFSTRVASALSFAHLTGFGARGKRAEEDDDDDKNKGRRADDDMDDDDDDEDGKKGRRAEADDRDDDDDDDRKGKKGKRARRAEADPDDEEEDGDEDDQGDDSKGKKGKRAKRAEDDEPEDDPDAEEDDDDEDGRKARGSRAYRQGVKAERARAARVHGSKHTTGRVALAARLLATTSMSSSQIIDVLRETPRDSSASGERSGRNPALGSDGGASPTRTAAIQSSWDRAMKRAGAAD
uniref:DNA primase n=1 Tax=Mycena chlorophos TaxID=658473 RepID=A0ABQ0KXL6_MYCCL|nr:predicted protein [Mycena chlorophos]